MKKREIVKRSKIYSIVYIFLIITILLLSIGFSSFSETLALNGAATLRPTLNARITDVGINKVTNGGLVNSNPIYAAYTVTSDITLPSPNSTVVLNVTVANLYSDNLVITAVENQVYSNNNIEYSFENLEINKTKIAPASVYTFQIVYKFKNGASTSNTDLNSILKFTYKRVPQYTFEINATPSGNKIELTAGGETYISTNGYISQIFDEGTSVSWKVTKTDYYDQSGTETIMSDISKSITLKEMPFGTFTVNPTPSDAVVTISEGNNVIKTGTGSQTVRLLEGTEITYSVSRLEYYDSTGSFTMVKADRSVNVTLNEMPWIMGTISNTSRTTAATKSDTNYHPGYYFVEVWGGRGGYGSGQNSGSSVAGEAGYVYGIVELKYGDTIFATAGGNGADKTASGTGGANGGASAGENSSQTAGSGGGYSAFVVGTSSINSNTISSGNVKLIAGGGGGGGGLGGIFGSYKGGNGGAGGKLSSTVTSITGGTVYSGENGTTPSSRGQGYGGSSTAGGTNSGGSSGTLLAGGAGKERGGGGGAGYYGGGGGSGTRALSGGSYGPAGGGGGSSFIATGVTTTLPSGVSTSSNPSSTGGAVIIKYIGKSL